MLVARRDISREMMLISCEREVCFGNSENGKIAMKEKGEYLKGTGDYQIGFPKLS